MSDSVPRTATWRATSASQRGSAHAGDVPNQDAARVRQVSTPRGDVWVAAVADGHGGARYVRSDVGARTAVDVAQDVVSDALAGEEEPDAALRAAVPRIVAVWREAVLTHAHDHPFTDAELARGADPGPTAYGATLLVAVVGGHGVALAQVGDGDALVRSHGFATRPVPGDDRLVAGETTSLCLDSAVDDFRHAVVPATADPDLVVLATDGYGNSFARADWWHVLVDDVADFVRESDVDQVARALPGWLEESARVGGDDVTAVLLVRDHLLETPVARAATPVAAPDLPDRPAPERPDVAAVPPRPARTRDLAEAPGGPPVPTRQDGAPARRRAAVVAVVAVAVAAAVAVAVALWGAGGQGPPADPTEPTVTTPSVTTSEAPGDDGGRKRDRERAPGTGSDTPSGPERRPGGTSGDEQPEEEAPDAPQRPG